MRFRHFHPDQLSSDLLDLAKTMYDPSTKTCYESDLPPGEYPSKLRFQVSHIDYSLRGFFDMGPYKGLTDFLGICSYPASEVEINVNTNTLMNDSLTTVSGGGYIIMTVKGPHGTDPNFIEMATQLWTGGHFMTSWGGYLLNTRDIIVESSLKIGLFDSKLKGLVKGQDVSWRNIFTTITE